LAVPDVWVAEGVSDKDVLKDFETAGIREVRVFGEGPVKVDFYLIGESGADVFVFFEETVVVEGVVAHFVHRACDLEPGFSAVERRVEVEYT